MSNSRTTPLVFTGGVVIAKSIERSMFLVLCGVVLAFSLSSCGPTDGLSPSASSGPLTTGKTIAAITAPAPPGSADRPLQPGQSGTEYMPNGLPVLPARGINADMLFAEKVSDPDDRFRRLENAVIDIRKEFDAVAPAIVRLSAVEQDMQTLLTQLQTLTQDAPPAPVMDLEAAPVPVVMDDALPPTAGLAPTDTATPETTAQPRGDPQPPDIPPLQKQPPPASSPGIPAFGTAASPDPAPLPKAGQIAVQGIRTGQQDNGATRLVLDLSGSTPYSFDLDNEENLLLIELPQAGWSAASQGTFAAAPLLTSWTTEPMKDGGVRLIIQLKQKVKIVSDSALADPARVMLDLKQNP